MFKCAALQNHFKNTFNCTGQMMPVLYLQNYECGERLKHGNHTADPSLFIVNKDRQMIEHKDNLEVILII